MSDKTELLTPSEQLRLWRTRNGLTQTQLAKHLEVTLTTICRLEKGRLTPGPELARQIRKLTGAAFELGGRFRS